MNSITLDKIPAYIETHLSIRDRVKQIENDRAEAFKLFASARENAGFKTKTGDFQSLSAEDLRALAADFSNAKPVNTELSTVGAYNSVTRKWKNPEVGNYSDISQVGVGAYDPKSKKWI